MSQSQNLIGNQAQSTLPVELPSEYGGLNVMKQSFETVAKAENPRQVNIRLYKNQ